MEQYNEKSVEKNRKDIINRLRTVKGHIAGIEKMVDEGKGCEDVLTQILAIKSSVHKIGLMVMESHALECLLDPDEDGKVEAERMEHIIHMILQFSK